MKFLRKTGFLAFDPTHSTEFFMSKNKKPDPFNVFVSEKIQTTGEILDPCNWYITELVKEGRLSES